MSLTTRVVPCPDVNDRRVVKGVNLENLRDASDPVEPARHYGEKGTDGLTFLDVTASKDGHGTMLDVVRRTASEVLIPLTVGGGVRSVEDVDQLPRAGADKVSVNTVAIAHPELLSKLSRRLGAQCVILLVDARRAPEEGTPQPSSLEMTTHGGSRSAGIDAVEWTRRGEELGVGEILLSSMSDDSTRDGFDLELLEKVRVAIDVPVTASDGVDKAEHFPSAVRVGANAVLVASIFHFGEVSIAKVKREMVREGIEARQ